MATTLRKIFNIYTVYASNFSFHLAQNMKISSRNLLSNRSNNENGITNPLSGARGGTAIAGASPKIDRWRASRLIARLGWNIEQDKELLLFPAL